MTTIRIDGRDCQTRNDINLLQACLEAGANLPYFCWHPELGSVGACRQCAVKQFSGPEDRKGRIVMACMTPVSENAIISIDNPEARDFRAGVIEWMMVNHPHDCPVCEEGGECHLQDMTVMTGHNTRRYRFTKRTHRNQDLGPFVKHEMNRCIACYRCVRFYRDYAGGDDLAAFASHDNVYFGRAEDGTLQNAFSGNLVEICPTGVFTDKPFSAVYTRKWDMRGAPSVCVHCAVGCNTIVNAREETLRRVLNRYNTDINRYVLCDRGRFGHGFVNAPTRIRTPLRTIDGQQVPVPMAEALTAFARMETKGRIVGIASPRAALETCFSLHALVGLEHFSTGQTRQEQECVELAHTLLTRHPGALPTLHEMESADAVLVLGEDVCATAPRLGLSLRQSVRQASFHTADNAKVPRWMDAAVRTLGSECPSALHVLTPAPTDLDSVAVEIFRSAPDDIARLGFAIAHAIDPSAPPVTDLTPDDAARAARIAQALLAAGKPLVVSGMQYGSPALMQGAASIAAALARATPAAGLSLVLPECNSMGLAMMGGLSLETVMEQARAGEISALVIVENDLTRALDPADVAELVAAVPNIVVIDHTVTPLCQHASLVLPIAAFSECSGTLISQEGRAQRFFQAVFPPAPIQAGWRWIQALARSLDPSMHPITGLIDWRDLDDVLAALATVFPDLAPAVMAAPEADYRINGEKLRSQTYRASGRTVIRSFISVRDQPPPASPDTPFSSSMEGAYEPDMPGALVPYYQTPAWNSVQALNRFQSEIGGPMRGGPSGIRLLSPAENQNTEAQPYAYNTAIPAPYVPQADTVLVLPDTHLFGSEELSMFSPPIMTRSSAPTLGLSASMTRSDRMVLHLEDGPHILSVEPVPGLPEGTVLCPTHMVARAFRFPRVARLESLPGEGERS
ncbi:NADH-quinone oxidoreductase subunit G [Acetobacter aceti NRIC 0242]|uniref:NADH-quinone oxidoreductase n=1 Tax=Acetobacter aceti NBRC 14818 TaxID=887700 RepID=A0AB33IKS4_ACEAC|nr:NADH-quinone oxidoreductase subunit NuoG [Acetobacter aceti]TCS32015.1 NADH dehydrogenase subunit G [Acetobacter aceti NBRC 14818]BCK77319.1 NADH-quinone oxidoreductase subunit G [Acetobacter aceti NBRC 14818]GAN58471.1 NADH-quinone oxidoreductase subunit G [Acetobacter aceti NBRC 14818]GBO81676.1 NADH-quinone oxidoreductase subunit G [Acetobacter aceti NRIC 0242]